MRCPPASGLDRHGSRERRAARRTRVGPVAAGVALALHQRPPDGEAQDRGSEPTVRSPSGDVRVSAGKLVLGENARIGGRLDWAAAEAPEIPPGVIAPERVRRLPRSEGDVLADLRDTLDDSVPELWPSLLGGVMAALVLLGFLLVLAAILFAFAPHAIERLRHRALAHPGLATLAGALGLATLVGAVPVAAITLLGLPLIPFLLLALFVLWTLGYGLGAHVVATRVWRAFDGVADGMGARLGTLAVAFVAIAALNFVPVVGWLVNLAVLLLGLGAMTLATAERIAARAGDEPRTVRLPSPES